MTTQGYGCVIICFWANGATLNDPTCDWPGMECKDSNVIIPVAGDSKDVFMDFRQALLEAGRTTGCCRNDPACRCMIRGTATFNQGTANNPAEEYSKVYMEFTCASLAGPNFGCSIPTFEEVEADQSALLLEEP